MMLIALLVLTAFPHERSRERGTSRRTGSSVRRSPTGLFTGDMASLVGQFTINGNNPNSVPKTPFRILFTASWGPECFPLTDSAAWRKYSAISLKWFRDLDFDATSKIPIFH
jgi:hypothetical protein